MKTSIRQAIRSLFNCLPPRLQARLQSLRARGSARLGYGAYVHRTAQLLGKTYIGIGSNSVVSERCWLNVNHRRGERLAIEIGDHCFIGRGNVFSSGEGIRLGHYVLTAHDCHFLGSTHIVSDPLVPCIQTGTTDTDRISVGHNTFFGAGSRVLGHVQIGHGCVIGAGSLVTRDVPPFSQVVGSPASVRRRYSFPRQAWVKLEEFTQQDEAALPSADSYLASLRLHPAPRMPYIAAGADMGDC